MKSRPRRWLSALLIASLCALIPPGNLFAQQDKVAALKQSLGENQKRLHQYKWVETTVVSLKGEEKSRTQKLCFYGPDGKVQKQPLTAPAPQQRPRRIEGQGHRQEKGGDDRLHAAGRRPGAPVRAPESAANSGREGGGRALMSPTGPGAVRVELHNYLKKGDSVESQPRYRQQFDSDSQRELLPGVGEGCDHVVGHLRPPRRRTLLPRQYRARSRLPRIYR